MCKHEDNTDGSVYLQVGSYKRLAARVVEVTLHEEVEKMGGVTADGAQLRVAAFEDFVAQRGTHVRPAVKEGAGELERDESSSTTHKCSD